MEKAKVLALIVEKLRTDLDVANRAVIEARERATHEECQAKSQYDTFALEASYLAHGQAKRAAEVELALERYRNLTSRTFNASTPIALTALISLETEAGETKVVFLGPDAGGQKVLCDGIKVVIVTPNAPLGEALLGKRVGDDVEVQLDRTTQVLEIVEVQ